MSPRKSAQPTLTDRERVLVLFTFCVTSTLWLAAVISVIVFHAFAGWL